MANEECTVCWVETESGEMAVRNPNGSLTVPKTEHVDLEHMLWKSRVRDQISRRAPGLADVYHGHRRKKRNHAGLAAEYEQMKRKERTRANQRSDKRAA